MRKSQKLLDDLLAENNSKYKHDIQSILQTAEEQGRLLDIPLLPLEYIAYLLTMHREVLKQKGKI